MSNFTFQHVDDDGTVITVDFESDIWIDAFPKFLQLCRAAGFIVDDGTALYSPTASEYMFGDRDFLIFDQDLTKFVVNDVEQEEKTLEKWAAEGGLNHAQSFYDVTRNR